MSRNSFPGTFSLTYFLFLSWITGTSFQWHKTKNIYSKNMMGLISLHFAGTVSSHTKYTLSILNTMSFPQYSINSQFFGRCERSNYFRGKNFREQKVSRGNKFAKLFGINFREWKDDKRFGRNKLSRIGRNQILRGHKLPRGWNIRKKNFTSFFLH